MANWAASTSATLRSTVPTSTAVCNATVVASHSSSASGAPGGDAPRCRQHRCTRHAEARGERTRQQRQEQHAAERDRLRQDGQAVDDDGEVAEQVDQQVHASGTVTVKATSPRVMWPSTASTCQRST